MCYDGAQFVLEKAKNLDWCLCIFFSVDIEGATKFKSEARARQHDQGWQTDNDWCSVFEKFYQDFPDFFRKSYSILSDRRETSDITQPCFPVIWKFVGDEILFYAPLTDSRQSLEHITAFCQAIKNYNKELANNGVDVQCKGTAWLAGFPMNNRIVLTSRSSTKSGSIIDFIGSSVDAGFRITKYSSSKRLVISLDLLWMLVETRHYCQDIARYHWFDIRFLGDHILKGVFSGQEYPIFRIVLTGENDDAWRMPPRVEYPAILDFLGSFSKRLSYHTFIRPFVVDDPCGLFADIPDKFAEQRELLIDYIINGQKELAGGDDCRQKEYPVELPEKSRVVEDLTTGNEATLYFF